MAGWDGTHALLIRLRQAADVTITSLAAYRRCCDRVSANWPAFLARREQRLAQQQRFGTAAEKVAENILEDLFTIVLDWSLTELNNQVDYADLVLTRLGIKHLIIEVKRPGSLAWRQGAVDAALHQARRYADEQRVGCIAVSDGVMLYAGDRVAGTNRERDRVFVSLDTAEPPAELWWLSVDGIYRTRDEAAGQRLLPATPVGEDLLPHQSGPQDLLHPKYRLPARCFGYVGSAADPRSWHLPYLLADGAPDLARLPKAIQAILSNYRGEHLTSIPESAIPEVLVTLGRTAALLGKLSSATPASPRAYRQLHEALEQLQRLDEALS